MSFFATEQTRASDPSGPTTNLGFSHFTLVSRPRVNVCGSSALTRIFKSGK
jgi:hypothetical protein